jgi:Mrp family chromosome partitioning ATPase
MFGKKKNIDQEELSPLGLTTREGSELLVLQPEIVETLRHMAARLTLSGDLPGRLAFVSAIRQEGVTYLSRAWGATIANDFRLKVGVIELNWWWPDHTPEIVKGSQGLAAVLHDEFSIDEVIFPTGDSNLDIIPAGSLGIGERPVIAHSDRLWEVIEELGTRYDHLVLDIPAIRATTDAIRLAALGQATCLVVQQGTTTVENVKLALDDIRDLPIMGIVLNKVKTNTPAWMLKFIPQDVNTLSGSL